MSNELPIVWNVLVMRERLDVILKTKNLAIALAHARWEQLTDSERNALLKVDWQKAVARV